MTGTDAGRERDDIDIRQLERDYDDAWNSGDLSRLASLYTPGDAVVNPLGERAHGREAIRASLEAFLTGPGRGSRHSSHVATISYVQETVAVVDGEARLEGVGGSFPNPVVTHVFTDIVVKEQQGWSLAQTRAYVFATLPFDTA
jgi:uncharacterized protein (TIGR02246 family)